MKPSFSCILTSYNQPLWLFQAITSVVNQTCNNFELFVMDDNSPSPEVHDVLHGFLTDKRIKIIVSDVQPEERMKICRYSYLINNALKLVQGDYITYLTDDDFYMPDRFEKMLRILQNENVHVVYGIQALQYGDSEPHDFRDPGRILNDAYDIVDHNSVMHCRHIYDEVGGWTEDPQHWRGADGQYWRKITEAGYLFYPVFHITDVHRFHTSSIRHKLLEQGLNDLN